MTKPTWESLMSEIDSIPANAITSSRIPMDTFLQEGNDLWTVVRIEDVAARLLKVGVDPVKLEFLGPTIDLLRDRQSTWIVVRDRTKSESQVLREAAGASLRSELVAAGRWHLRHDKQAQSVLDAISQGDSAEDLIQDLEDLATLLEKHHGTFATDQTWEVSTKTEQARSLASEIRAGKSAAIADLSQEEAKVNRDRAFTYLDGLITEIRDGGRWAFRNDPTRLRWFGSAYARRRGANARAKSASGESAA